MGNSGPLDIDYLMNASYAVCAWHCALYIFLSRCQVEMIFFLSYLDGEIFIYVSFDLRP